MTNSNCVGGWHWNGWHESRYVLVHVRMTSTMRNAPSAGARNIGLRESFNVELQWIVYCSFSSVSGRVIHVPHRSGFCFVAALGVVAIISSPALAVSLYWDNDDNPVGNAVNITGGTGLGGTGTWDTSSLKWWDGVSSDVAWTDGNDALFYGNASYTVTQSGNFNPNSLTFGVGVGNVVITGGTLTIGSPTNSIVMKTNDERHGPRAASSTQLLAAPILPWWCPLLAGINSFLTLGANPAGVTNTFTGDLIFAGANTSNAGSRHQIAIDNPTALPATATVRMKRNICQLLFGGVRLGALPPTPPHSTTTSSSTTAAAARSRKGSAPAPPGRVITLGGVISGNANLVFELGAGAGRYDCSGEQCNLYRQYPNQLEHTGSDPSGSQQRSSGRYAVHC